MLTHVKPSSFSALLKTNKKSPNTNWDHRLITATNINETKRRHFFPKGIGTAETILTVLVTVSATHFHY